MKHNSLDQNNYTQIHSLVNKFADANNRNDFSLIKSLWSENGIWEFKPPINEEYEGADLIAKTAIKKLEPFSFFNQMVTSGTIKFEDISATGRFYITEIGKIKNENGVYYSAIYEDEYIKKDNRWLFKKRTFNLQYALEFEMDGNVFPLNMNNI